MMNLHRITVGRAKNNEDENRSFGALLLPLIHRDRMKEKQELLTAYFQTIISDEDQTKSGMISFWFFFRLISGRDHPSFFGTPQKCYQDYLAFCDRQRPVPEDEAIVKTERIFHQERRKRRIGCEQGYDYNA